MDIISASIVLSLASGVIGGTAKVGESLIVDTYDALKAAIKSVCGVESDVVKAIAQVEQKPDSEGRKVTLQEEVAAAKLTANPDLMAKAQAVLEAVKKQPGGEQHVQQAIGKNIAQADRGGIAKVIINSKENDDE